MAERRSNLTELYTIMLLSNNSREVVKQHAGTPPKWNRQPTGIFTDCICYTFPMQFEYFIASRWRNKETVLELTEKLRQKGKTVYCFIEGDGTHYELKDAEQAHTPEAFMKKFENIPDWRNDKRVQEIFDIDMKALKNSEKLILLLPAGKSAHMEAGVAYGMGKKCIVIGEQKETESLYFIFDEFYNTIDDFIASLDI